MQPTGPNAQQIEYWNEQAGPKWVALREQLDGQIRPLGNHALLRGGISAGERVLDVGCGCGDTTLEIARRLGSEGSVTGVDISAVMLSNAEKHVQTAGVRNVRFLNSDAQTRPFEPSSFDLVYSRFGVMFFVDPEAAFGNLRSALTRGGRLSFVCWQSIARNPWMLVPLLAASKHITLPEPPPPDAPGPFSFAEVERVRRILEGAGFTDLAFEAVEETLLLGGQGDLDRAVDFVLQIGPTAAALREADSKRRALVSSAVREALRPHATAEGVRMPCAAWIVTARRSD